MLSLLSKDHVHLPTVSSPGDLAAFLRFSFGIFDLYARGLLVYSECGGQREGALSEQPYDANMPLQNL